MRNFKSYKSLIFIPLLAILLAVGLVSGFTRLAYSCSEECPTPTEPPCPVECPTPTPTVVLTPTPAPAEARVTFCSNPSGSEVWLDYSYRGDTSLDLTMSAGSHHVGFYKAGFHSNTALETDFTLGDGSITIGADMINGQIVSDCSFSVATPTPTPTISSTPAPTTAPTSAPSSNNGGGGSSTTNPSVCGDQKPGLPYNLLAAAGPGDGQATLTWGPPLGPVSDYSIVYSDDTNVQKWGVVSTGNSRDYTISSLAVTKYYFWVKAVNGCMPGDYIGPVSVGGTGGPDFGPAVLGLSDTSGGENYFLAIAQMLAVSAVAFAGFSFFKKNA